MDRTSQDIITQHIIRQTFMFFFVGLIRCLSNEMIF